MVTNKYVMRALDQICYINFGYHYVNMALKLIAVDKSWKMYMFDLSHDNEPFTSVNTMFPLEVRHKLLHVYQRDSFWFVYSISDKNETILDVYYPNIKLFESIIVCKETCVDVLQDGADVTLLTQTNVGFYDIITRKITWLHTNGYKTKNDKERDFSMMWKNNNNTLHILDDKHVFSVNQEDESISLLHKKLGPYNYICDVDFDIKSNSHDHNFPFVACFLITEHSEFLSEEISFLEALQFNAAQKIVSKNPVNFAERMPYNQICDQQYVLQKNVREDSSKYSLFDYNFVTILNEFERTQYFRMCEKPTFYKYIELVVASDSFGSSWFLYQHPHSKVIHCIPDSSSWVKIFVTNISFNFHLSFLTFDSNRISFIVKLKCH